jgi:hypothetical protein
MLHTAMEFMGSCEHGNETSGCKNRRVISGLDEELLVSQEGLLISYLIRILGK